MTAGKPSLLELVRVLRGRVLNECMLRFTKMNGAGNDFILFDNRTESIALDRSQIAQLCDRHRGIGADGILLLGKANKPRGFSDALL